MNNDDSRDESRDDAPGADEPIRVGGYELLREIGHGGQATIFVATQLSTGRKVAVKFMYGGQVASGVERSRMEQEVRILAALDHPNLVSVIDRGETADGSIYFVMPYVQGRTLNEFLDDFHKENGAPDKVKDLAPLLRIFVRVCDAVNAAHLRGVVHRDLKPSNIIVDTYGEPHILDFGLARSPLPSVSADGSSRLITQTGEFVGSLQWASPEQAEGAAQKIDIRSDVYSLGVILYELLTGEFPYDVFSSMREVLNNIVTAQPRALSAVIAESATPEGGTLPADFESPVDDLLDVIVLKALQKKPEDRYQSAGEFAKAVNYYLSGYGSIARPRPAPAPPPAAPTAPPPKPASRAKLWIAAAVLVVLVAVAVWRLPRNRATWSAAGFGEANPVGYLLEDDSVTFEFDPDSYDKVRLPDGRFDKVSAGGPVRKVTVAGPFNAWGEAAGDWTLKREAGGIFRLNVPLRAFAGRHVWPFKFVVNGLIWVGAPLDAPNRELVVTDAATYNLLLFNPGEKPDPSTVQLKQFRDRINKSWPGQGANLTRDDKGGYHFIFNYLPAGLQVGHLDPLAGIPLVSLDLGATRIADFSPLASMTTLDTLVMSDETYSVLTGDLVTLLEAGDYTAALAAAKKSFEPYSTVPAFARALSRLAEGISFMAAGGAGAGDGPPAGAQEFGGHHYLYLPRPMLWSEARDYARARGADLAAVGSAEEMVWLSKTFGQPGMGRRIWLGGSDEAREGFWTWSNGERWAFENWTPPEPDNLNGVEHCLAMKYDSWWTDNDGGLHFPSVIEWSR